MNDANRSLRMAVRSNSQMFFALAAIIFGLSVRSFAGLDQKEGAMYTVALVGGILQTIGLPTLCICMGLVNRRALRATEPA